MSAPKKKLRRSGRSPDAAPPALQFYLDDFFSDEHVMAMSNREVGCYLKLLRCQWKKGWIPEDAKSLANVCGETERDMAKLWPAIRPCYVAVAGMAGRLQNKRMERERQLQAEYRAVKEKAGKLGAEKRWHKDGTPIAEGMAGASRERRPASAGGTYVPPSCAPESASEPGARASGDDVADDISDRCPSCRTLAPSKLIIDDPHAEACPVHGKPVRGFGVHRCECGHTWGRTPEPIVRACLRCLAPPPSTHDTRVERVNASRMRRESPTS